MILFTEFSRSVIIMFVSARAKRREIFLKFYIEKYLVVSIVMQLTCFCFIDIDVQSFANMIDI